MKSFCIKTNNKNILAYLLNNFNFPNTYISIRKFKIYKNIIIHYIGENASAFYNELANNLVSLILNFYEENLLKSIIKSNYFYFSESEQDIVLDKCLTYLKDTSSVEYQVRIEHIYIAALKYITNNKSMILRGFILFRLSNYMKILDYVVDTFVNELVVDREYKEFINLLKSYVNSKPSNINTVHFIYKNTSSILLDNKHKKIPFTDDLANLNYISDVSFSENDIVLNTLLTLLPQKIIIHLEKEPDEFIKTLICIFENRIELISGSRDVPKNPYLQ
ncbi:sporulation protein YtxC [Clostridium sp. CAG:354]|nr:sporulation protein YtxC [Clostridium sp. CAG:354]